MIYKISVRWDKDHGLKDEMIIETPLSNGSRLEFIKDVGHVVNKAADHLNIHALRPPEYLKIEEKEE